MDDMAVISKCIKNVVKFKSELRQHWDIKDMGEMH